MLIIASFPMPVGSQTEKPTAIVALSVGGFPAHPDGLQDWMEPLVTTPVAQARLTVVGLLVAYILMIYLLVGWVVTAPCFAGGWVGLSQTPRGTMVCLHESRDSGPAWDPDS